MKKIFNCDKMIEELESYRGKEVRIFGQQVTLPKEVGKFEIDIINVIRTLKDYDYNVYDLCKDLGVDIKEEMGEDYFKNLEYVDITEDIITTLVGKGILEEKGHGYNTYNWDSPISNDIDYHCYMDKKDNYYIMLCVHLFGDIRSCYTDYILLKFDYETEFHEVLEELRILYVLEYNGVLYDCQCSIFEEGVTVYDLLSGEYLFCALGIDEEDIKEEIENYIKDRNKKIKVGNTICLLQTNNKELNNILSYENWNFEIKEVNKQEKYFIAENLNKKAKNYRIKVRFYDIFEIHEVLEP